MRFYPPIRVLSVISGLSRATVHDLVQDELHKLWNMRNIFFDVNTNWSEEHIVNDFHSDLIGIVDCTELRINVWHSDAFSVKKACHTLKYQVVINISTGRPLHICGPFKGSVHDAKVYLKSGFALWLLDNNLRILGDKAYVGSSCVIAPIKKSNTAVTPEARSRYNKKLAQKRIRVENHFASLKHWRVVTHCYRGDVENHHKIFFAAEILEILRQFVNTNEIY
jgi:hypothetical protein